MHPAEIIRATKSRLLTGKTIVLAVTGSIGAVRTVELARELIRHGARVVPVMSPDALAILHPNALEFATGETPILQLTGMVEHVSIVGRGPGKADLLLIAPCTGNTLGKIARGIDDTVVTTFATNAIGAMPVMLAPAMHDTMYDNPFVAENLRRLREAGVEILAPQMAEHKAKLADPLAITEHVLRRLGPQTLRGKRLLVINGATQEPIDAMRVVSNRSTGAMGAALVREAQRLGAEVEHWFGTGDLRVLPDVPTQHYHTLDDLLAKVDEAAQFDAVIVPAALSDYAPEPYDGKMSSEAEDPTLPLVAQPKFIRVLRERYQGVLVSFKAEDALDHDELVRRARASMQKAGSTFVVANCLGDVHADTTSVLLVEADSDTAVKGTKDDVAIAILDRLARHFEVER